MPFFSVVIPAYNRAKLIVPVIQSVLGQSFTDFELLVIDDGSTDETHEVIDQYFGSHPQVIYYKKKNEERSVARNTGLQLAQGQYVIFHDSDDLMEPNHLAVLDDKIGQHPQGNFFATKFATLRHGQRMPSDIAGLPEGFYDYHFLLAGNPLAAFVCVKKDNPDWLPFPPEFNMCEDWIFHFCNYYQDKIYLIDQVTLVLADHDQRSMANNQHAIRGRLAAMAYLEARLPLPPDERLLLRGYSYRFCAIHSYLDGRRGQALGHWGRCVANLGLSQAQLLLLGKILVGKQMIDWAKPGRWRPN
jgi:glycosyltransferase involved in cell wall biosynthesis